MEPNSLGTAAAAIFELEDIKLIETEYNRGRKDISPAADPDNTAALFYEYYPQGLLVALIVIQSALFTTAKVEFITP